MQRKLTALILAAFLFLTLFAGCTGANGGAASTAAAATTTAAATTKAATTAAATTATTATTAAPQPKVNPAGVLPVVNDHTELSFAMPVSTVIEDRTKNETWLYLQEQTGITFTLEEYPANEFFTRIDLMMAAGGGDLPDIIAGGNVVAGSRSAWGQAGFLVDLLPYFDEWLHFLPIAYDNCGYTDWETAVTQVTSPDGAVYGLPSYAESPNDRVSNGRLIFYLPWLEDADLLQWDEHGEFFTQADQVLSYYEAVKAGDFNGNGQHDEIPLTGNGSSGLRHAFLPMFLKRNPDAFYIDTASNTVKFNFDTAEYRDGVRFLRDMIAKGYLDPLSFTQDHAAMTALITAPTMVVASYARYSQSNLNLTTVPPSTDFSWCAALAAPGETERYQFYTKAIAYVQYLVTANCENVEAALRLGDYWGSEEVSFINRFGFEGVDWDWASDLPDKDKWGNYWGEPLDKTFVLRTAETGGRAAWGTLQNVWMANQGVSVINYGAATWRGTDKTLPTWAEDVRYAQRILYHLTLTDTANVLAGQVYTEDETAVVTDIYTPIATYADECFTRFVMGDMDIEKDWDAYVAEFHKMGLEKVIAAENACYDRMYK